MLIFRPHLMLFTVSGVTYVYTVTYKEIIIRFLTQKLWSSAAESCVYSASSHTLMGSLMQLLFISHEAIVYPTFTTLLTSISSLFSPHSLCSLCCPVSPPTNNGVAVSPGFPGCVCWAPIVAYHCSCQCCLLCTRCASYPGGDIHITTLRSVWDWLKVNPLLLSRAYRHTGSKLYEGFR